MACGGGGDGSTDEPQDGGTGAPAQDGGASAPAAHWSEVYPLIFPSTTNARCDFCHSMPASDTSNGKLSMGMSKAEAYAALVGKTSSSSMCGGKPLVVPHQPEMSLFLQKLKANPPCGSRMPVGGMPLSDTQLEAIRSWIAAGAKDD